MELHLKVKHFNGAIYLKRGQCPVSFALNDHFGTTDCYDSISKCHVRNNAGTFVFKHDPYRIDHYNDDIILANKYKSNPDHIIRTVTLLIV